jgi:bidirectional [NiFe] hydrogenase diaphorase subunit
MNEELTRITADELQARQQYRYRINVCIAAGCLSTHSDQVQETIEARVKQRGLDKICRVRGVGCMGLCAAGPLVSVDPGEIMYQAVTPENASVIVDQIAALEPKIAQAAPPQPEDEPIPEVTSRPTVASPFFQRQVKIVLENSGKIDPERIEDYIAEGGYSALVKVLTEMMPSDVIEQVTKSGLRGRGGAGYPTGLKWSTVAKAISNEKYVICNGDEGDPGAFMDRSVMEADPHRIIEGMVIAGYAIGAENGYVYVRAEYPLAVKRLQIAIRQAQKMGFLGRSIGGTTFNFHLEVRLGAGAFVCGEETALMASVQGRRGTPRSRPPYPAESGLFNKPTLVNNVETFANIAPILRNGGAWFAGIGTDKSKGTKVFALSGNVKNIGLIEVPMGITLREIVYDIGGGIPDGRHLKAIQTGGPSGGCISAEYLNTPVDFESLAKLGSIMGSGGMIIMDETSCMVDVAKYFMEFCMSESCGKCVPCRVGTKQMHDLLVKITTGHATLDDLALLEELCEVVRNTSLCGLGQSAPNTVLSTLKYFRDEYLAHIIEKRCPAGVCKMAKELVR